MKERSMRHAFGMENSVGDDMIIQTSMYTLVGIIFYLNVIVVSCVPIPNKYVQMYCRGV